MAAAKRCDLAAYWGVHFDCFLSNNHFGCVKAPSSRELNENLRKTPKRLRWVSRFANSVVSLHFNLSFCLRPRPQHIPPLPAGCCTHSSRIVQMSSCQMEPALAETTQSSPVTTRKCWNRLKYWRTVTVENVRLWLIKQTFGWDFSELNVYISNKL